MTSDMTVDRELRRMSVLHARELAGARRRASSARASAARVVVLRGGTRPAPRTWPTWDHSGAGGAATPAEGVPGRLR